MLIKHGAEAELRRTEFMGRAAVEKFRVPKSYRIAALDDELRRSRIRMEARLMADARAAGVAVPILYDIDLVENKIVMEFVEGPTVKSVLEGGGPAGLKTASALHCSWQQPVARSATGVSTGRARLILKGEAAPMPSTPHPE